MKMSVLLFAFLFIIPSYVFGGNPIVIKHKTGNNVYANLTVGNHTYVSVNKDETPDQYKDEILAILSEFERINTDKDVVGWKIEMYYRPPFIYGLWIDHKPK